MHAYRASLFHFLDTTTLATVQTNRKDTSGPKTFEYFEDGLLVVQDGRVQQIGDYATLYKTLPAGTPITHYPNSLITPGFIDTHAHMPQTAVIAAYGEQLLDWLNNYVFPAEASFADIAYAREGAVMFLEQMLRSGTTTVSTFSSVHKAATDILFEEAERRNMRMIIGKTLMDRNVPESIQDNTHAYDDCTALIDRWHGRNRLHYVVTPRFAPTSTEAQLEMCKALLNYRPDLYLQTHVSENKNEIQWVLSLFPKRKSYTDVYDHYGLLTPRSIFAHCIHLSDAELQTFKDTQSIISWCPTSNSFLGSGLFDYEHAKAFTDRITLGSDVSAGTSFCQLQTLGETYKVSALNNQKLPSMERWFLATLGAAQSLGLADKIGNFSVGKEADFIVLNTHATPLMQYRMAAVDNIFDLLFTLMTLGDDRVVTATYVMGILRHAQNKASA